MELMIYIRYTDIDKMENYPHHDYNECTKQLIINSLIIFQTGLPSLPRKSWSVGQS